MSVNIRVCREMLKEIKQIKIAFEKQGLDLSDSQATKYLLSLRKKGDSVPVGKKYVLKLK